MGSDLVVPRSSAEAILSTIWAGLLGLMPMSVHDNFFDLDGHSLMATQLSLRINDAFQIEQLQRTIFMSSTIAELATVIVELQMTQLTDEEFMGLLEFDQRACNADRFCLEQV